MRDAVLRQAESDFGNLQEYNRDIEDARSEKINRLASAWEMTNDRDRKDELRQIERDYKDRIRDAGRNLRDDEKAAKRQFNDDKRNCREEQKDRCQKVECENGRRVKSCDEDGNPIDNPCDGQNNSSSSSRSSRSSSSRSSSSGDRCRSSNDCDDDEYCTVEDGQCLSPICPPNQYCPAVCEGTCKKRSSSSRSSRSSISSSSRSSSRSSSSRSVSSSRSSSSRSSSRSAECGNGRCEDGENAILCPTCAPGTPYEQCRCRHVCEADCG